LRRLLASLCVLLLVAITALAQDASEPSDNGFLLNLLENRLSSPGRQIRLQGVTGALSSRARIERVTISDAEGAWLEIDTVELDWSRLALLRGRVAINRLSANRIAWLRRPEIPPAPKSRLPQQAEAQPFQLPQLPVSIQVAELQVGSFSFAESVFGQAADFSVEGALNLTRGTLQSNLDIRRLDGPGGNLTLVAGFSNATRQLDIDLDLHEPEGGVVATLLRIEGTPAIDLTVEGSGPLDQVDVTFALDAAQDRIAQGLVALRSNDEGLGFDVDFTGGLSPMIPAQYRDFFAGDSTVQAQGVSLAGGGVRVDGFSVAGAVLDIDGALQTAPDGFLRNLTVSGTLGDPRGPAVVLPVPGGRTRLHSAALHVDYGDASRWNGFVVLDRLQAGGVEMEDVTLRLGGLAQNLDEPARRNVTVNVEGLATGLWAPEPEVAQALGSRIDLFADAVLPPGGPITLRQLQVSGNGLSIFSAGEFQNMTYTGRNAIRVADIAVFAGLANRPLGGAVNVRANGSVTLLSGGFDLTFDGGSTDLRLGDARLDRLLAGETTISGRAVRDEAGIRTEDLRVANPQLSFASNGSIASSSTDIGFEAALTDLALVDPRLGGRLTASGRAAGEGQTITVTVSAAIPEGSVSGRRLTGVRLGFQGDVTGSDVTGDLTGAGGLDGLVLSLAGAVAVEGDDRALSGLEVRVGPNRLTGDLAQSGTAPVTGGLTLTAPDISSIATLALTEASGALDADIRLDVAAVGQGVTLTARGRDLAVGTNRIGSIDADARVEDALGVPLVNGTLGAADLSLAGVEVASLGARAQQVDQNRMQFSAQSRLAVGTLVDLSGELQRLEDGVATRLDTLRLRQQGVAATLTAPATVTLRDGTVDLTPVRLDFGSGSLTAQGRIDDTFDVGLTIENLPLDLANAIQPGLGLAGRVNGTARVTGPRAEPDVNFTLAVADAASAMTRGAGIPPVALNATGATADGRLNLDATIAAQGGLASRAQGSIPLGAGNLDLRVDLQSFPLALVDRLAGNRGLRGTVSGQGTVTGPLADPAVQFDVRGEGLTATILATNAIPPLAVTASGEYRRAAVTLRTAQVTGGGGIDISGSGRIPFSGPGLDVSVAGTVPLAIANPLLEARDSQAAGLLRLNATARGSLAAPQLGGTASLSGGTFVDPGINLRLEGIALEASLEGRDAVLRSFSANVATGGRITAQGRVSLNAAAGYPADLSGRILDVRYTDGAFVSTRLSGELALRGPLVGGGGLLAGTIDLGRTEISISEGLGVSAQASLEEVQHRDTPRPVQITLDRARAGAPSAASRTASGPGIGLDVRINAPNQIFVRGRGLDVELGGSVRIQGTTTDIQPVGQFDLRRGRLLILGQRIEFDEGSLTLIGNLDPEINFVARTQSRDVTAIVTVSGRVSSPDITFASEPPLPQDEVLARVLFNRATANLSPFQLAQLAAAAAELAGGGGPGILSRVRGATGLDDLDIITQEDGSTAVRAGKYIDENIYVDVQTDTEGISQVEINLDVSERVTVRGSVASDGNTTIGLFYERDY
jgi:translocation and assembly module TamB